MTSDGYTSFAYDATGRETSASSGVSHTYDGDLMRIKRVENGQTTLYLRSSVLGGAVIAEMNAQGNWTRGYVYGESGGLTAIQQPEGYVEWVTQDPVTKGQRITNAQGTVTASLEFDPFGGETSKSYNSYRQPQKYTSYTRDSNGTDDTMHRRYSAYWSRFQQPDPYDGSYNLADPQSFNRYAYVGNDPVNFTDPSGLLMWAGPWIDGGSVEVTGYYDPSISLFGGSVFDRPYSDHWGTAPFDTPDPGVPGGTSDPLDPDAPTTEPAAQSNDPCAGKKGAINPNKQGGLKAGIDHISDRHIRPQGSEWKGKKSIFEFGSLFTKGQPSATKPQREDIVLGMLQTAFEKGAANKLTGGDYAYSYAPFASAGGVSADFIGSDISHGGQFTNVRTVVLDISDCSNPILKSGFPGLVTNAPNVNGTPTWKPVSVVIR